MRTAPNINEELRRFDDTINNKLIPSFTENKLCEKDERLLLSLPTKLGGMGEWAYLFFSQITSIEFQNPSLLTKEHVSLIAWQERTYRIQKETINNIKKKIKWDRQEYNQQKLTDIKSRLTSQQCRLNDINTEQGTSTWLTTLPIEEGYMLDKQEFWDLVNIRCGRPFPRTPRTCLCGNKFNIEHALTCKKREFITLCHNRLSNITVTLLKEVCHDVRIEPT